MNILEQGHIYFYSAPRIGRDQPENTQAVQRLYMVLHPRGEKKYRRIILRQQKKPGPEESGSDKCWGFVERVIAGRNLLDQEQLEQDRHGMGTRGERRQPARPAGEGVYAILDHDSHAHLAYVLELPRIPGPIQQDVRIELEASHIITIKKPGLTGPPAAGLSGWHEKARFRQWLEHEFAGKRFIPPYPRLLDYEGTEIVLISAAQDVREELGIELDVEQEFAQSAAIFKRLRLEKGAVQVDLRDRRSETF